MARGSLDSKLAGFYTLPATQELNPRPLDLRFNVLKTTQLRTPLVQNGNMLGVHVTRYVHVNQGMYEYDTYMVTLPYQVVAGQ